jgi:restriction endonuclease S subunit
MISKYMVLVASEQKLLMMRPYQIYAVKAIVDCIDQNCGNGYIWHTTGSGKTLTSFKASTLLKTNESIQKCLFVVDRKDWPAILSNWFLYYQLQLLKPLFERIATGSTIKTIGLPFFNAMRITIPRIAEQQRIAACLSSLDEMLAAQSRKVEGLKAHKQALLQQLFPALEGQ